jgi:hypothetical protein
VGIRSMATPNPRPSAEQFRGGTAPDYESGVLDRGLDVPRACAARARDHALRGYRPGSTAGSCPGEPHCPPGRGAGSSERERPGHPTAHRRHRSRLDQSTTDRARACWPQGPCGGRSPRSQTQGTSGTSGTVFEIVPSIRERLGTAAVTSELTKGGRCGIPCSLRPGTAGNETTSALSIPAVPRFPIRRMGTGTRKGCWRNSNTTGQNQDEAHGRPTLAR